jgi:hypothetical protein
MTGRKPGNRPPSNFVAEWFGHIVWPPEQVDASQAAISDQVEERCPFLSSATASNVSCIKKVSAGSYRSGFCTASSPSTGVREDWLACPARVFDQHFALIRAAIVHLFQVPADAEFEAYPLTRFDDPDVQAKVHQLDSGNGGPRVFAFASNPPLLGGEIDIPETAGSPGNKVDVSIFEILRVEKGRPVLGRFAIFEIQTADFHGSPLHAIGELRRLGPPTTDRDYHDAIAANPELLGKRVEGPNKANIFKRTIYQMILKIQMAKDPGCAGFCVVLPEPVWRSWERHLGSPALTSDPDRPGVLRMTAPSESRQVDPLVEKEPAWILVFRIDRESKETPRPLEIVKQIATDSHALLHHAFEEAPRLAVAEGALERFSAAFERRLGAAWEKG